MLGFAKRESPDEWAPQIEQRLEQVAGCKELVQSRVLLRNRLEPVVTIIEKVQTAFEDKVLPQQPWADWVCAWAAFQHLKPHKATSDLMGLLKSLEIHSTGGTVDYDPRRPSWFTKYFSDQDRIHGVVADRFVAFLDKVVLPQQVKAGPSGRNRLEEFIVALVKYINELPEAYSSSQVLRPFKERLLGALAAFGRIPFLQGSTSEHIARLTENPKNPFTAVVTETKFKETNSSKQGCFFQPCKPAFRPDKNLPEIRRMKLKLKSKDFMQTLRRQ